MLEIPSMRPETRYGIPSADRYLFNRRYIVGYSYLFRQPQWVAELIDPDSLVVNQDERLNNFRPDQRIPEMFRSDLDDFRGTGLDRGHMVSSADRREKAISNSETFLLSNMCPQHPSLNRKIWRVLEEQVRFLAGQEEILEVYVVSGILFDITKEFQLIGQGESKVIVPHFFFKSIVAENIRGKLDLWTFRFPNEQCDDELNEYLIKTRKVEVWSGLSLWDRIQSQSFEGLKNETNSWVMLDDPR